MGCVRWTTERCRPGDDYQIPARSTRQSRRLTAQSASSVVHAHATHDAIRLTRYSTARAEPANSGHPSWRRSCATCRSRRIPGSSSTPRAATTPPSSSWRRIARSWRRWIFSRPSWTIPTTSGASPRPTRSRPLCDGRDTVVALNLVGWPRDTFTVQPVGRGDTAGRTWRARRRIRVGRALGGRRRAEVRMAAIGEVHPDRIVTNECATRDALVLTKPLGTGVLTTAPSATC